MPARTASSSPSAGPPSARPALTLTQAVAPDGRLQIATGCDEVLELSRPSGPHTRELRLNRPQALHSLSAGMVRALHARVLALREAADTSCVLLTSSTPGRALCAGGDVRRLHALGMEVATAGYADAFFRAEYTLFHALSRLSAPDPRAEAEAEAEEKAEKEGAGKPLLVPLLDGLTMGGGVGLVQHGPVRVATERTVWAMPECAIGLHPDVGASHFLSRMGATGRYLALTGGRVVGRNVVRLGLATHFVSSGSVARLVALLSEQPVASGGAALDIVTAFAADAKNDASADDDNDDDDGALRDAVGGGGAADRVIARCFAHERAEAVIDALRACVADSRDAKEAAFARAALHAIEAACPTSVKVAAEALRRARTLSLAQCLRMDFRLTARCVRRADLYEGVRVALVDRGDAPIWAPARLSDVPDDDVLRMFGPLDDLGLDELELEDDDVKERGTPTAKL